MPSTTPATHSLFSLHTTDFRWLGLVSLIHFILAIAIFGGKTQPLPPPSAEISISLRPENTRPTPPAPPIRPKAIHIATPQTTQLSSPTPNTVPASEQPSASSTANTANSIPSTPVISTPQFDAAYLNNPPPTYPPLSRRMNEQGRVVLLVNVGADGLPKTISIVKSSTSQRLDDAAINAVWKWKFVAAQQNGQATPASVNVPITFKLD